MSAFSARFYDGRVRPESDEEVYFQQINPIRKYRLHLDMQDCMHITCMITGDVPLPYLKHIPCTVSDMCEDYLEIIRQKFWLLGRPILLIPFLLLIDTGSLICSNIINLMI